MNQSLQVGRKVGDLLRVNRFALVKLFAQRSGKHPPSVGLFNQLFDLPIELRDPTLDIFQLFLRVHAQILQRLNIAV